jgi:hypothetical protein
VRDPRSSAAERPAFAGRVVAAPDAQFAFAGGAHGVDSGSRWDGEHSALNRAVAHGMVGAGRAMDPRDNGFGVETGR